MLKEEEYIIGKLLNSTIMSKTIITISKNIISSVTKSTESKKKLVNPDGTIAESLETYKQFKADLANRSYGC